MAKIYIAEEQIAGMPNGLLSSVRGAGEVIP